MYQCHGLLSKGMKHPCQEEEKHLHRQKHKVISLLISMLLKLYHDSDFEQRNPPMTLCLPASLKLGLDDLKLGNLTGAFPLPFPSATLPNCCFPCCIYIYIYICQICKIVRYNKKKVTKIDQNTIRKNKIKTTTTTLYKLEVSLRFSLKIQKFEEGIKQKMSFLFDHAYFSSHK